MPTEWIAGLAGGLMIGLAAALYLLGAGKVMGASGVIGGLVDGSGRDSAAERLVFLAALAGVPAAAVWALGGADTHLTTNPALLVVAGACVGLGTRLARGCTSGHGVCGLSRLSVRGMVATALYVGAGAVTVFVVRHLLGGA